MRAEQKLTSSLPFQPTTFVGRSAELAAIARLLANPACRLLTLHGPGGIGKTRLALAVAASEAAAFPDGVAFVALASISMPSQIVSAIGEALRLSFVGQSDPTSHLLSELRERHMLLVLDNFEHLLEGADLVSDILAHAPHVTVVVTSRERLNLQAEWLFNVDGLVFPQQQPHAPATSQNLATLAAYSAVELFVQRARQVQPELALDEATLTTIVQICRHVAGMPLAIELAATGLRARSLAAIERQIRANLDGLAASLSRCASPAPQLAGGVRPFLESVERIRARRCSASLAVFRGGWTVEAAEQVAGATLPMIIVLVDKSLLRKDSEGPPGAIDCSALDAAPELRFVMLEPLCEYALEQLVARGEEAMVRQAHATYYLALAEAAAAQWDTPTAEVAIAQLDREHDNMRAALQWACDTGNSTAGLQLALALWGFWRSYGYNSEGRAWLGQLLSVGRASRRCRRHGRTTNALCMRRPGWPPTSTITQLPHGCSSRVWRCAGHWGRPRARRICCATRRARRVPRGTMGGQPRYWRTCWRGTARWTIARPPQVLAWGFRSTNWGRCCASSGWCCASRVTSCAPQRCSKRVWSSTARSATA